MIMKVLFVHNGLSSFVERDLDILRSRYELTEVWYKHHILDTLRVVREVSRSSMVFCWFASIHSFFAIVLGKLLKRKCVVVAGGYDVVDMPEIGYGLMRRTPKRVFARFVLNHADRIVAVSRSNMAEAIRNAGVDPQKIEVVYHGFEWKNLQTDLTKEDCVITVSAVSKLNLARKGLETFVEAAAYLPGVKFVLVGNWQDHAIGHLRSIANTNVHFAGFVPHEDLVNYMRKAKVYVQVSAHEGFGCALAEAMLCKCVPVVTERGAIPEVVGNTGFYVPYRDPRATAAAIEKALGSNKGEEAMNRIKELFPLQKRRIRLIAVVEDLHTVGLRPSSNALIRRHAKGLSCE